MANTPPPADCSAPPLRRRKRSQAVGLTAMGAVSMLSACSSGPSEEELSREMFGPTTDVAMFQNSSECQSSGVYDAETCDEAQSFAWNADNDAAPRFEDSSDCESQFGYGNCHSRGSGYFIPRMTGFIIGNALNGPRYRYAGVYRDQRDDQYYTGNGAWLHSSGRNGYRYKIGTRAFDPVTSPKVQARSAIRSRGGFGARASIGRGGGWGG